MTSQLNVDTIVDKAGSGGSNVKMANTSTYVSDGGSATQNTVQSLGKAYHANNFANGAFFDSFNISSKTERATGSMYGNFTNNMSSANFIVVGGVAANAPGSMASTDRNRVILVNSDTSARYACNSASTSNAMSNVSYVSGAALGDLA
jgi:hypothetical protein